MLCFSYLILIFVFVFSRLLGPNNYVFVYSSSSLYCSRTVSLDLNRNTFALPLHSLLLTSFYLLCFGRCGARSFRGSNGHGDLSVLLASVTTKSIHTVCWNHLYKFIWNVSLPRKYYFSYIHFVHRGPQLRLSLNIFIFYITPPPSIPSANLERSSCNQIHSCRVHSVVVFSIHFLVLFKL